MIKAAKKITVTLGATLLASLLLSACTNGPASDRAATETAATQQAELVRVTAIYDLIIDFSLSKRSDADHARKFIPTGAELRTAVQKGDLALDKAVESLQERIDDHSKILRQALQRGNAYAKDFLAFYKEKTGRDYFEDAKTLQP